MTDQEYLDILSTIKGKTIGIIYVYEKDDAQGADRYDPWKGDVLADWVHAIYELKGLPLVMDVRTFLEKAAYKTLPKIDYIVNLSNGCYELSTLGLVPSICSYFNIPCIPSSADVLLLGENKYISNIVAGNCGFSLPRLLNKESPNSITRPYNLGSSCGVYRGESDTCESKSFIQEFISGFDLTIPIIYNPLQNRLVTLPAVVYCPNTSDTQWFLGATQKQLHKEYKKMTIDVCSLVEKLLINTAIVFGITTYCRIDTRCHCSTIEEVKEILSDGVSIDKIKFIEINPLPTIKDKINFLTSLENLKKDNEMFKCLSLYNSVIAEHTLVGFILSTSIIALKAKH